MKFLLFLFRIRFYLFLLIPVLASCKKPPTTTGELSARYKVEEAEFNYLKAKSKMFYEGSDQSLRTAVDIRMKSDSLMWLSVRPALGIEAARGLITRDSVFLLNKLGKTAYIYDYSQLSKRLNMEADFELVQAAFLGNLYPVEGELSKPEKDGEQFLVKLVNELFRMESRIDRNTGKLTKVNAVQNENENNTFEANYSDFKKTGKYSIPHKADFTAKFEDKKTHIEMEHTKLEFTDEVLSFPFKIPAKYVRKVMK